MMKRFAMTLACGLALATAQAASAADAAADNGSQSLQEPGKADAPATTDSAKMQATPKGTDTMENGRGSSDQAAQGDESTASDQGAQRDAPATVDSQKMAKTPEGSDTMDQGRGSQTAEAAPAAPAALVNTAKQDPMRTTGVNSNARSNKASSSASSSKAMFYTPQVSASPFKMNDGRDDNIVSLRDTTAGASGTGSADTAASADTEQLDVATDDGSASSVNYPSVAPPKQP